MKPGDVAFEPGPGMGFFTLELARRVGPEGRVFTADIQPRMLKVLERRAAKAGVLSRIETRLASGSLSPSCTRCPTSHAFLPKRVPS